MSTESTNKPLITIVIPVYNRKTIVADTLASVAAQSLRPLNVVLVDNASTDGTMETLLSWKESMKDDSALDITVTSCSTPGAAAARNAGLALTVTPWVMFFDSDDIMSPDHAKLAVEDIKINPEADIIGWDVCYCDISRADKLIKRRFSTHDMLWKNIFNGLLSTLRYCARTTLIKKAGGWNEKVGLWDDIELGCRLLALNPCVIKSKFNDNRVTVRVSANSITGGPDTTPTRMKEAIESIAATIGKHRIHWVKLKETVAAAVSAKNGSKEGQMLYHQLLSVCDGIGQRLLLRIAYHYTRLGGRGIAAIYRKSLLF